MEVSKLEVSEVEVSELEVSELVVSKVEVSKLEVSELEVSEVEVSEVDSDLLISCLPSTTNVLQVSGYRLHHLTLYMISSSHPLLCVREEHVSADLRIYRILRSAAAPAAGGLNTSL